MTSAGDAAPAKPMQEHDIQKPAKRTSRLFVLSGWIATALGMILWGYGYFTTGTLPAGHLEHLPAGLGCRLAPELRGRDRHGAADPWQRAAVLGHLEVALAAARQPDLIALEECRDLRPLGQGAEHLP
jgi:hypothetical protein